MRSFSFPPPIRGKPRFFGPPASPFLFPFPSSERENPHRRPCRLHPRNPDPPCGPGLLFTSSRGRGNGPRLSGSHDARSRLPCRLGHPGQPAPTGALPGEKPHRSPPERPPIGTARHCLVNVPGTDCWHVACHRHAIPGGGAHKRQLCLAKMEIRPRWQHPPPP